MGMKRSVTEENAVGGGIAPLPPLEVGVNTERDLVSPRVEKVTSVGSGWLAI